MCLAPAPVIKPAPLPTRGNGTPPPSTSPLQAGAPGAPAPTKQQPTPPAPDPAAIYGQRLGLDKLRIGVQDTKMGPNGALPSADRTSAYGPPPPPQPIGMAPTLPRLPRIWGI